MRENSFFSVRQDNAFSITELTLLVRRAFVSLYPGTSFDAATTEAYGSENCFFLSRNGCSEAMVVFTAAEPLDAEVLSGFARRAAELESRVRGFRGHTRDFFVSVATAEISESLKQAVRDRYSGWSFFEFILLQSETDEGLALKLIQTQKKRPVLAPWPAVSSLETVRKTTIIPAAPTQREKITERRLNPEELSALIDLSLGLEMRSRGMDWEVPSSLHSPREIDSAGLEDHPRQKSDVHPDIEA